MLHSINLTSILPLASFSGVVLGMLMGFLSLFLIMLILVQRGRGGGLSGALGGPGGQSAFGSKAGDTFTIITVSVAGVWILVCAFAMWLLGMHTPAVADLTNETTMSDGPGTDAEDIASGLVVPTLGGDDDSDDADMVPADASTPADASNPEEEVATEGEPASEESPAEETESADEAETAEETAEPKSE